MTKLVIVESPTKAKTIGKFLGKDYIVESSFGHIRDLPKSDLGVDVEKNFEPRYVIPTKSRKRVNELKKISRNAEEIILASDEDREGEAIAWHLTKALELDSEKLGSTKRIVFHEITKDAIDEALKSPKEIDQDRVDAQQARRILDRLVGYELSPFLWKKFFRGLSAGRVQSVAVRLICERENEINKFNPEEYWSIVASLLKIKDKKSNLKNSEFEARLAKKDGKTLDKLEVKSEKEANQILKDLEDAKYEVSKITKKEINRQPSPPFTTSTLQQTASSRLGYSAKQTMMFAQQLYENGLITYMRTDSVNLSADSLSVAKSIIESSFGKEFSLPSPRRFKTKSKGAQEAHEAIRPSNPKKAPEDLKSKLDPKAFKLYDLVWRRFLACQMREAIFDSTSIEIDADRYGFKASGSTLKFAGWLKVMQTNFEEKLLPELKEKDSLELKKITPEQHFTEPPPRYNEAKLVKALEENGIGRPSTYAPIISTIQSRGYVIKNDAKRLEPTEIGTKVNALLVEHFPQIVDISFTAKMENDLDSIAEGREKWPPIIKMFYQPFHENLEKKYDEVKKQTTEEKTDEVCEKCGKPMVVKHGRFGQFLACSGFPDCKNAKNLKQNEPKDVGVECPECHKGKILERRTRKRKIFYSCSRYPDCEYALWDKPTGEQCPDCKSLLTENAKGVVKCSSKECKYKKEAAD